MITQRKAKQLIQSQWDNWDAKSGAKAGGDKPAFYEWMKQNRPDLLNFPADGDRWQIVNVWLRGR
ncbi:MAG: hypothetical protein QF893_03605 [Alphaproteobacteria bacterium]|jgi:hypothetical protein|nr:hypothetical protein [Alphaproteobacteria bacterium]